MTGASLGIFKGWRGGRREGFIVINFRARVTSSRFRCANGFHVQDLPKGSFEAPGTPVTF